jgi:hypothetical protein
MLYWMTQGVEDHHAHQILFANQRSANGNSVETSYPMNPYTMFIHIFPLTCDYLSIISWLIRGAPGVPKKRIENDLISLVLASNLTQLGGTTGTSRARRGLGSGGEFIISEWTLGGFSMDYVDICCGILGCDIRSSSDYFGMGSHEAWPCHMCRTIVIFTHR